MATRSWRRAEWRPARHDRLGSSHPRAAAIGSGQADAGHVPLLEVLVGIHQLQRLRGRGQITGWEYLRRRGQLLDCL